MTFAFLFLVYDKIIKANIIKEFIKHDNIYIHAKNKDQVNEEFKQYIIKDMVKTDWCDISLVDATLLLLKQAYENKNNEWFFLLSHDTIPIYNYELFIEKFNKLHNNKSIFNLKAINDKYYKTSQWWVMNRHDVKIILNNKIKFNFKKSSLIGCADENYFLSILKWNDINYDFTNLQIMYDKWLKYTIQQSPVIFNKILQTEIDNFNNALFIRKITDHFTLEIYKPKRKLYVIYIGTETIQSIPENNEFDIILLISIDIKLIKKEIIDRALYIYKIIWSFYYESIIDICNDNMLKNWELIIFTTEKFNLNNYNSISKIKLELPVNKLKIPLKNLKEFYYITDNNNNLAFCYK